MAEEFNGDPLDAIFNFTNFIAALQIDCDPLSELV